MKGLLIYLKQYRKECVLGPLFKLLEALFELFVPLVMTSIIDVGIATGSRRYILERCGLLVLLAVVGLVCSITATVHELLRKSPPLSLTVAEVYEKLAGRQVDISRSRPDFITEAIVYHPSAAPVCQEDLFFTVRAVAHTAAQWAKWVSSMPFISSRAMT